MKKSDFKSKFTTAIFVTILLIYFMMKTTGSKLIFLPFLICSITMIGKLVALLLGENKIGDFFGRLFAVGFFLFWFGFLIFAAYICLRDQEYGLLLYSGIFWIVGIIFARSKLFGNKMSKSKIGIPPWGAVLLVVSLITLLIVGFGLLLQGILEKEFGLFFMGSFFFFGALVFVLGALTIKGCFDQCKIDILGLYVGIFFVLCGSGMIVMLYQQQFGAWMIIPVLMIIAGMVQIVKCIKRVR